jgi:type IV secretion system protein VirB5
MKKKLAVMTVLFSFSFSSPTNAGIPVFVDADIPATFNQIETMMQWIEQLKKMKDQLDQQVATYKSLTGSRGLGDLLNNTALKNYLPPEWQNVYTSLQNGGYAGLTGSAKAIRDANMIYNCADKTGPALTLCQRELSKTAQDKALAQGAYTAAKQRIAQIDGLIGQINSTTDPKAIAELQARIAGETAQIQNETTKLQLFQMLAQAEEKLIQQQKYELLMKNATSTDMGPLENMPRVVISY